ncbi:MAG: hypothetical protein F2793_00535 [Actinobacteria bacterium]|uniref:Unannotated protein n=1 Tax=freshwater metagenome TaxID=449393 RepID=A0A6J7CQ01_9ZZZZ|nr:hypothetical protein [Actinomycetota bacterium]
MTTPSMHAHPAWFGSVMGTAALAVVLSNEGQTWAAPWMDPIAVAVLVAATAFAVALVPRYVRRFFQTERLRADLSDPSIGPMLGTFPAGILLLASAWGVVGPILVGATAALWIDAILLIVGVVLALGLSIAWAALTSRSDIGLASVHGGWLIPPVMNLLVPLAIVPLVFANPGTASVLILIGLAFLGIGACLFIAVFAMIVARVAICPPAPALVAPSLWVPLAPAGLLGAATLRLLQAGVAGDLWGPQAVWFGTAIAAMGIGFGLWWAVFALLELMRLRRSGGLPFHIGWWSFVFPTAAMALSIGAVGDATGLLAVEALGAIAALVLACVWATVATRTILAVREQGRSARS